MTPPEEMSTNQIREELAALAIALADDPQRELFGERIERREALRNEVRQRGATAADAEALERELVGLVRRIGRIEADRINPAAMAEGGQVGDGPLDVQRVAWQYDEASGHQAIIDRIAFIKYRLAQAGSDTGA